MLMLTLMLLSLELMSSFLVAEGVRLLQQLLLLLLPLLLLMVMMMPFLLPLVVVLLRLPHVLLGLQ